VKKYSSSVAKATAVCDAAVFDRLINKIQIIILALQQGRLVVFVQNMLIYLRCVSQTATTLLFLELKEN